MPTAEQWHGSTLLLVPTLVGDGLCAALAAFGDLTGRHTMPHLFWWILWPAQVPLGVQMVLGLVLLAAGARPPSPYHLMYAALIVLTLAGLHGLRPAGWLRASFGAETRYRESRWLLLLCLFLGGLVARAYVTGLGGR